MKTFILDSSVYISYLNPSDVFHKDSKDFIQLTALPDVNFLVPITVFLEVGNVLQQKISNFDNKKLIKFFEEHTIINLDLELAKQLLTLFKGFHLKTSDATIASCASLSRATLITWDSQLVKRSKKIITVQTPRDFQQSINSN